MLIYVVLKVLSEEDESVQKDIQEWNQKLERKAVQEYLKWKQQEEKHKETIDSVIKRYVHITIILSMIF